MLQGLQGSMSLPHLFYVLDLCAEYACDFHVQHTADWQTAHAQHIDSTQNVLTVTHDSTCQLEVIIFLKFRVFEQLVSLGGVPLLSWQVLGQDPCSSCCPLILQFLLKGYCPPPPLFLAVAIDILGIAG